MREFKTSPTKAPTRRSTPFTLDGWEGTLYEPTVEMYSVLATIGAFPIKETASDVVSVLLLCVDPESRVHLKERLTDPEDSFTLSGDGGAWDMVKYILDQFPKGE